MTHDAAREIALIVVQSEHDDAPAYIVAQNILDKLAEMGYRQLSPEFVKEFDAMALRFPPETET